MQAQQLKPFVNRLRLPPGGSFAFGTAADASENLKQSSGDGSWGGGRYSSKGSWSSAGGWVIALAGTASNVALCASDEVQAEKDAANAMLDTMWPLIEKLGWGSVMGWATGVALQKIGKFVGFFVGCTFMVVQAASSQGYIDVNWNKAERDLFKLLDINKDGQLDREDARILLDKFIEVTTYNLPSAGGFTAGLALGLGMSGRTAAIAGGASMLPRLVLLGSGAAAGPGVMVGAKEYYDAATRATAAAIDKGRQLSSDELFKFSLQGAGLDALRAAERQVRSELRAASDSAERATLADRVLLIERLKADAKARARAR